MYVGTFKLKKTTLQAEGYDVTKVKVRKQTFLHIIKFHPVIFFLPFQDPVFLMDRKAGTYVKLTEAMLDDINNAKIR